MPLKTHLGIDLDEIINDVSLFIITKVQSDSGKCQTYKIQVEKVKKRLKMDNLRNASQVSSCLSNHQEVH